MDELLDEIGELRAQGAILSEHDYSGLDIGKPGIVKAMCLHAAHDCNLRCRYCFASTGDFHGERSLLPLETGKKALDWLVAHSGNRHQLEVDFFGGEPLMNYDVVHDLVLYARELEKKHDKHFQLTITTNALGLTDERIEFLNREMHNIVLSIDGRREVHDYMRPMVNGKGSFDEAVKRAKKLVNLRGDGQYYVRGTYTARNLDFGNDVLALADEGFEQLSIEPVVLEESSPFALTKEMLPEILAEYDRFAKIYLERRKNGPWMNFFHFMVDLDGGPCVKKRVKGCGAGNEYVAVTPEGRHLPLPPVCRPPRLQDGQRIDRRIRYRNAKALRRQHRAFQGKVRKVLGALLLRRRLRGQRRGLQWRHLQALRYGMRTGKKAPRVRAGHLRH